MDASAAGQIQSRSGRPSKSHADSQAGGVGPAMQYQALGEAEQADPATSQQYGAAPVGQVRVSHHLGWAPGKQDRGRRWQEQHARRRGPRAVLEVLMDARARRRSRAAFAQGQLRTGRPGGQPLGQPVSGPCWKVEEWEW
eukprot:1919774-Alexandrium_andersonii.AAC.1